MCDSMDGRNIDPTSYQYNLIHMPMLKSLSLQGVNFIRTYTNSPECVPSRAAFMTGRHTHKQGAFNNNMGFAISSNGKYDKYCIKTYDKQTCKYLGHTVQNNNYTLLDAMENIGYEVYLYGKIDMGGGIVQMSKYKKNTRNNGWYVQTLVFLGMCNYIDPCVVGDFIQASRTFFACFYTCCKYSKTNQK